jgi:hypothetical protein
MVVRGTTEALELVCDDAGGVHVRSSRPDSAALRMVSAAVLVSAERATEVGVPLGASRVGPERVGSVGARVVVNNPLRRFGLAVAANGTLGGSLVSIREHTVRGARRLTSLLGGDSGAAADATVVPIYLHAT